MRLIAFAVGLSVVLAGCAGSSGIQETGSPVGMNTVSDTPELPTNTPTPELTATPTPEPTATATATPTPSPPSNPWKKETITVHVDNVAEPDRNYAPMVHKAIQYWNDNNEFYTEFEGRFIYQPISASPDILIEVVEEQPTCGFSYNEGGYPGCATLLDVNSIPDTPERIVIVGGLTAESVELVLKHEFGHIQGLSHEDGPAEIMGESAEITYLSEPDARNRDYPWEKHRFDVYLEVDGQYAGVEHQVRRQVEYALEYYSSGAGGWLEEDVTYEFVSDYNQSDIAISISGEIDSGYYSSDEKYGQNIDQDPALEYYTTQDIVISGVDPDRIGWHVGYWMGTALGAQSTSDLAPPFDEPNSDPREQWWH